MKRKYSETFKSRKHKLDFNGEIEEIHSKKRGRPLLLGVELDSKVQKYVTVLRDNGAVINTQIVIAAAKGIVNGTDKSLHVENGGSDYLDRIEKTVNDFDIPSSLIINWDHAGLNIIPVSNWTMATERSKRVEISSLGDKRQITAVFAGTLSGEFLPPQLIYGGKTDKCHPTYKFPIDWNIIHSENHWANTDTQMDYVKNIIIPYVKNVKRKGNYAKDQKALCIFDVFRAQMGEEFLEYLDEKHIKVVFVPACCTDRLQPLDVSVQKAVKNHLRQSFQEWYSEQIVKQLNVKESSDENDETVKPVDLSLTRIKPLSAKWIVKMFQHLKNNPEIIRSGFRETGISSALDYILEDELPLAQMLRAK